ncbi:MAG: S8 family serine peptidase [Bacteroidota bacterium]
MKRYLLLLFVMSIISEKLIAQKLPSKTPINNVFIVILKETFEKPIIKKQKTPLERDRTKRHTADAVERKRIRTRIMNDFAFVMKNDATIQGQDSVKMFADGVVGFRINISDLKDLDSLKKDARVKGVYQDYNSQFIPLTNQSLTDQVSIQRTPILQVKYERTPILQRPLTIERTPILQRESTDGTNPYDDLDLDPTTLQTIAVQKAGGSQNQYNATGNNAIWFLDTGIDPLHADLNVSTKYSRSFASGERNDYTDNNGHGTHCAGIAAAINNGFGVTGVAAGARVIGVKVLGDSGNGSWSSLIKGLDYVAEYGIKGDVVNMSLGIFSKEEDPIKKELTVLMNNLVVKGIMISISAGNAADSAKYNLPGGINGTGIFTTAALTREVETHTDIFDDRYSNFNVKELVDGPVDFVGVGTYVLSTWPGYKDASGKYQSQYCILSGTSMASAVTAGVLFNTNINRTKPVVTTKINWDNITYSLVKWR